MEYDATVLQNFSDSLAGNIPADIGAVDLDILIACLRAENIKNAGAADAAHSIVVRALLSLPDLGFSALAHVDPTIRELLLTYLASNIPMDETLERVLTRMRRTLLSDVLAAAEVGEFGLDLLSALAVSAFGKEYIFTETSEETHALRQISIYKGAAHVATMACYRALYTLHEPVWLLDTEQPTAQYGRLLTIQIAEPLEERRLRTEIRSLSPITERTSVSVRQMYEENPYPRWTKRPVRRALAGGAGANILVAGCGSGQQPIGIALSQPACRVIGLDLSLASLAYALRKSRDYGVPNLELVHGDILALESSGLTFDFISSIGVLHHMADPAKGLKALSAVLADNGRIELGLYSKAGHYAVLHAIAARERLGVPATPEGIRKLRRYILDLPADAPARGITQLADFYTMSGCRDLVFHVQEHRFTLPAVDKLVKDAGLMLRKFHVSAALSAQFRAQIPDGDESNLFDWARFEAANPLTFRSMYILSVVKPSQ